MKFKFYYVFILLYMICHSINASRIMGGEISYTNISSNQYQFYLTIYRDCSGSDFDQSYTLSYKSASCSGSNGNFSVSKSGQEIEMNINCPSKINTCNGGTDLGIQKQVYTGIVTLPKQCNDWIVSWEPGPGTKRNSATTNILNPSTQNFYLEAKINNLTVTNNSSPSFSGMAFSYLYTNKTGTIKNEVIESNGDSLKFSLISPKTSATTNVTYVNNLSSSNPVTSLTSGIFNSKTGDLTLTPNSVEISATTIVVEEFKNGVSIGSSMRDFQIITLSVSNNNPFLSGINNTLTDSINVCEGSTVNITIYGKDADSQQNLTASWDNNLKLNSSNGIDKFEVIGSTGADTIKINWNAPKKSIGRKTFTITLSDDNCPLIGTVTKTYVVNVKANPSFNLANDSTLNCSQQKKLKAFNLKGSFPFKYEWSNGATVDSIVVDPGNYWLKIFDNNNCSFSDSVSIKSGVESFFVFDSLCAKSITNFKDLSFSKSGAKIIKWGWNFGDTISLSNNISILQNPSHVYANEGYYNVKLKVEDEFGCKTDTTLQIHLCSKPSPNFEIKDTCKRNPAYIKDLTVTKSCGIAKYEFSFVHQTKNKTEKVEYLFPSSPPFIPGKSNQELLQKWLPSDSGTYLATMTATNENGCRNSVTKSVHIRPQPIVHLKEKGYNFRCDSPDTALHVLDTMTIKSSLPKNVLTWKPLKLTWEKNGAGIGKDSLTKHISGGGKYLVKVSDMFGCDSIETVTILQSTVANVSNWAFCTQGDSVKFKDNSVSKWKITAHDWSFGDGTSTTIASTDTSILNTRHLYPKDNIYNVILKITDETSCTDTASLKVLVNALQNTFTANPSPVCVGAPIKITSNTGSYIDTLYWNFGDGEKLKIDPTKMTILGKQKVYKGIHSFAKYGTGQYTITLRTLYNNKRCDKYENIDIALFPEFKVKLDNPIGLCADIPTKFNARRTSGGVVTNWNWIFYSEDSNPPYNILPLDSIKVPVVNTIDKTLNGQSKTFSKGGKYFLELKTTNADGCEYKIEKQQFKILKLPSPNFCFDQLCVTNPTQFALFCNNFPEVTINRFKWDFGDGANSLINDTVYKASIPYTYNNVGTYKVKASIGNTLYNCVKDTTISINIKPVAFPNFIADTVCYKLSTKFTNKSTTVPGDTISKWLWEFGDDSTSTVELPTHKYNEAGKFIVSLSATNKNANCTKKISFPIIVKPTPKAGFTYDIMKVTAQKPIQFVDSSSNDVIAWQYNFVNGNSTDQNPIYSFPISDIYQVKQIVSNESNCYDSISKNVDLKIYLAFPTGFSPNGDGLNDKFYPITRGVQKIEELKIYNRWGELIWETNGSFDENWDNESHGWDGKCKGEDQPIGVYTYYVSAISYLGEPIQRQGKITLIR